jgi:hypothetical protein
MRMRQNGKILESQTQMHWMWSDVMTMKSADAEKMLVEERADVRGTDPQYGVIFAIQILGEDHSL